MNEIPYHRIGAQFYNRPLLLLPSTAATISSFLLSRMAGRGAALQNDAASSYQWFPAQVREDGSMEVHSMRASRFHAETPRTDDGRPAPFARTKDGVAVITLVGEFVNRGAWIGASSGLISYEGFKFQMQSAAADPRSRAIVLDIESPGGEAVGAFEAAAVVREVAETKPVIAVVNGLCASAAYALASGATRIVTMPTGICGSIGVVLMHLDFSKMLADAGVKPTLIFAGDHKIDGNPFEPLPEDVRADFQREVESFYDQFVDTVAHGRTEMSEGDIRATEAHVFKGRDAVEAGLADAVGTFEEVLADLSSSASEDFIATKGPNMSKSTGEPAADAGTAAKPAEPKPTTAAELAAAFPDLAAELRADGARAESARIAGIEAHALPGHEKLVAEMKADGKTTPDQAASRILQAEKAKGGQHLQALKDADASAVVKPAATAAGSQPASKASTPDEWKAEWERTPALQSEFASSADYVAFKRAEASGKVRVLRGAEERKAS